ncbi:MAG: hypothetical protein AAGU27_18050 [Dehalobacterium sp.]
MAVKFKTNYLLKPDCATVRKRNINFGQHQSTDCPLPEYQNKEGRFYRLRVGKRWLICRPLFILNIIIHR